VILIGRAHGNGMRKRKQVERVRARSALPWPTCLRLERTLTHREGGYGRLIEETLQLDWLLLTKRPVRILPMVPWKTIWPKNVWLGTTVEDQESAEQRLPHLSRVPALVRFISAEPLLGDLRIAGWLGWSIDWVITGGESGP
jgi:Protein of unknown function (DUF5131)